VRRSPSEVLATIADHGVRFASGGLPPARTAVPRADTRYDVLPNGIRVATEGMEGSHAVSLGVFVDAGPEDEPQTLHGVAHLAERLLLQGTTSRSALDIGRLVDGVGGDLGGFTSRDYTCFFANVLDDDHPRALELFGDCLQNATFPQASLERQREAVLSEMATEDDRPRSRVVSLLRREAWDGGALGRSITGTRTGVRNVTRDDVLRFVRHHYTPDRIVVSAAGNVDHDDFLTRCEEAFGGLEGRRLPRSVPPSGFRSGLVTEGSAGELAHFALGIPCGAYGSPDRHERGALAGVLGGGVSSRLYRRLHEDLGLVHEIGTEVLAYRNGGMLVIRGSCAAWVLLGVMEEATTQILDLASGAAPVEEAELESCRSRLRAVQLLRGESSYARMSRIATQLLHFGEPASEAEILADIDEIELDSVRGFATGAWRRGIADAAIAVLDPLGASRRFEALSTCGESLYGT